MIQSTNPAWSSGISVLMPRPAGVIAPVRLIATVTLGSSIRLGEELAGLAQPPRVVGEEGLVDQVRRGLAAGDRRRRDAGAAQVRARRVVTWLEISRVSSSCQS